MYQMKLKYILHTLVHIRARTHTYIHRAAAIPGLNKRVHWNPLNADSGASIALDRRMRTFMGSNINPELRKCDSEAHTAVKVLYLQRCDSAILVSSSFPAVLLQLELPSPARVIRTHTDASRDFWSSLLFLFGKYCSKYRRNKRHWVWSVGKVAYWRTEQTKECVCGLFAVINV